MKKYLTKERTMLIVGLLVLILGLTSCNGLVGVPLDKFDIQSEGILIILSWPIGWIMHLIGSIFPSGSGQFAWGLFFTTLIVLLVKLLILYSSSKFALVYRLKFNILL